MVIVLYNPKRDKIALWDGLVYPDYSAIWLGWPHLEQAIDYGWEVIGTL